MNTGRSGAGPECAARCVEVAVFCPLPRTFTYLWPEVLGAPVEGVRVRVPFGRGARPGVVVAEEAQPAQGVALREVADRLDETPLYPGDYRRWLARLARYYLAAPGEAWEMALAWAGSDEHRQWRCADREALAVLDPELAAAFSDRRARSARTLARRAGAERLHHRLRRAARRGLIREADYGEPERHAADPADAIPPELHPAQAEALEAISSVRGFRSFLLFGRTGSGKTEVYLRAADEVVKRGGQVLVLVPEIGLTPMWVSRLAARFAGVSVWHSNLARRERLRVRRELPETQVLIGTRSALFLPLARLGLVVVDEEHDGSFKQQEGVGYSARDMAVLLAQERGVPVVLGSATPSLESWRRAREGSYALLTLPRRIRPHPDPTPEIIDMRGTDAPLSKRLLEALARTKEAGGQSMLYLNRRGYAPALHCTACGDVPECPACALRLTLHRGRRELRCHACGFRRPVPGACEACGESAFLPLGAGTERAGEQLREALPELTFARLDRDTMTSMSRFRGVLDAFAAGEIDCLVGTQMIVKGHHFPNVTLVGVINADLGLNLPDFRAGERWWQQITQVLGRVGRGGDPGRIVIQSFSPDAPWLARVGDAHAADVLTDELTLREQLGYPPFARWVRLLFSSPDAARAETAAASLGEALRARLDGVGVVGPMPSPVERLAGRFRFELLLRDAGRTRLPWHLAPLLAAAPVPPGVRRKVDVDPLDMM